MLLRCFALSEGRHFGGGALRSRSRAAPIRHFALMERAQNYLAQGNKGMARRDLERILAEDSRYTGVREQLEELGE
jgi:Tfp pilus assembly protein PilF